MYAHKKRASCVHPNMPDSRVDCILTVLRKHIDTTGKQILNVIKDLVLILFTIPSSFFYVYRKQYNVPPIGFK